MDEYDKKFAEMQKYIPFLEAMIERLQNVKDKSREIQLQKMQSLHGILSNSKRKLKIETLQRCEDVLQKLHNKVEKGNAPGLHFPNKKGDGNLAQPSTASEETGLDQCRRTQQMEETPKEKEIDETPASPSPPVSPDSGSQTAPIIIPTERSVDFIDDKPDSKPASPDQVDTLPAKPPIIIPTERTTNPIVLSPGSKHISSKNVDDITFSEWEMLEECEKQNVRGKSNWQTVTSSHDVATAAKMVGNNLPQKVTDGRTHVTISSRHIPTVPVPALGGSRRLSSVLEKNRLSGLSLDVGTPDSRPESPVNVPDIRLKSPDPDILFPKHKSTSPRLKDSHVVAKTIAKPSAPLLLSPPPVSTEPPLSMEDLAELLNEETDGKAEKKGDRSNEESKFKKDGSKQESSSVGNKEVKISKPFLLTQEDIDRENERRWEEIDKHIVKLTSRKCLPSMVSTSPMSTKIETLKSNEIKGSPVQSGGSMHPNAGPFSLNPEKADGRNRPPSPGSKAEPRYADNYERHPRQPRDIHGHEKDKPTPVLHGRINDDDIPNPLHPNAANKPDERNTTLYQRRQGSIGPEVVPPRIETDFRMDGPDYFNRQMPNAPHWQPHHPPGNANEFCSNQWSQPQNFSNPPVQSYQHPMGMHQEMWNVGAGGNPLHMDPHQINEPQLRSGQFPPNLGTGIRPLMSPTARPPDINHPQRVDNKREDLPNANVPVIQPLMSPTSFPVGPQYRNFQGEVQSRPYEPSFDRGMDYSHNRQSWDNPASRTGEMPYRGENEVPCGMIGSDGPAGTSGSYPRPSTPCPWTRDRDRCNRGRNREAFYNERNRGETRGNFNRDARRPEWSRDSHADWDNCNRFNRDARSISDRDPRVRVEHNVPASGGQQSRDNNGSSVRDPRLAKDKHLPTSKAKDPVYNERDPRKRPVPPPLLTSPRKTKEKPKSPKSNDSHRRAENEGKHGQDKSAKDKMQSPLESLYGVIDTKAKSAQGYCLQNFKIPKIKRAEPSQSPTSSHSSDESKTNEGKEKIEKVQETKVAKNETERLNTDKDDAAAEVSSSSDGNVIGENWNGDEGSEKKEDPKETDTSGSVEDSDKSESKVGDADSISTSSCKSPTSSDKVKKEDADGDGPKSKDEVTQEWIEALIRKSFEFGEGKKLVEQAKLIQKLEALQAKKLKKIKKIIESESESSSSEKDESVEVKKLRTRKKRRVIVSDSSDEECLAERLGILSSTPSKEEEPVNSAVEDTKKETDANKEAEKSASTSSHETATKDEAEQEKTAKTNDTRDVATEERKDEEKTELAPIEKTEEPEKESVDSKDASCKTSETTEDKETTPKIPKTKAKRRNSLEMLQEDIREMFISEGVVTATGHRMCRMQKENQTAGPSSTPSTPQTVTPITKKEETVVKEQSSDVEEPVVATVKQKKSTRSRSTEDTSKSKLKAKSEPQRVTRQRLKQFVHSSDSEEDQPLALRTEIIQNSSLASSQDESSRHDEQSNESLRRSKRVIRKENIKEPRVIVEKTDIAKLDCSKVMFDSSSDESFGIDVSELAAAVDISLHPEKPAESGTVDSTEQPKVKSEQETSKKSSKKKANETVPEEKVEEVPFFTDEESVISDISMSSSVASSKKLSIGTTKTEANANEELLSNILVGLVGTKSDMDNSSTINDKGSDGDVDDDANDQVPIEQGTRRGSGKKKKKKFNWQMGILAKKKRKKALTSPSPKNETDVLNSSTETEGSLKMDIPVEPKTEEMDSAPLESTSRTSEVKSEEKDVLNDSENPETVSNKEKPNDSTVPSSSSSNPKDSPLKSTTSGEKLLETRDDVKDVSEKAPSEESASKKNVGDNKKAAYDDLIDKAIRSIDIKKLTDYAWTGQDRYKCLLCFFTGKNIVHHYKLNHPGKEILISRLKSTDARTAVDDAKANNITETSILPLTVETCKFNCRFCLYSTEGAANVAMEAFYEHCTTHTGEYRFQCNSCPYQAVAKSSMRTHYYKVCRKFNDTFNEAITEDEIPKDNCICGYLCSSCNYVQLKKPNVEKHIEFWHGDDADVQVIKINMSLDAVSDEVPADSKTIKTEEEPAKIDAEKVEAAVSEEIQVDAPSRKDDSIAKPGETKEPKASKTKEPGSSKAKVPKGEKESKVKHESDEKKMQVEPEAPLPTEKLSVFVCPPELENKEVEIQLERKKKMQEIIENIGIKLNKGTSKKGFSIIDKLKDKMKTNLQAGNTQNNESNPTSESTSKDSSQSSSSKSSESQNNTAESAATTSNVNTVEDTETRLSSGQEDTSTSEKQTESTAAKSTELLGMDTDSQFPTDVDKSEMKVRDPLTTIVDEKKSYESEAETSDNDTMRDAGPIYDSDSSSEQSDSEPPTDVNMLLKETSNINASSKDPMITTIQRLAAQLQASKPLESCKAENPAKSEEATGKTSPVPVVPKPPNVVPIANIKRFVGKLDARYQELLPDMQDSNSQKNFIRLRRLSGDMLSAATQAEEDAALAAADGSQGSSTIEGLLQSDAEEECSFLKIENVVSLAPRSESDGAESPIINDIRKAVETSPIKNKGVSVLKKSNTTPFILKRLNAVTIAQPLNKNIQGIPSTTQDTLKIIPVKTLSTTTPAMTTTHLTTNYVPIAPKSKIIQLDSNKLSFPLSVNKNSVITPVTTRTVTVTGQSSPVNSNYKIVKVVRTPTVLKPKESVGQPVAIKLKSADAYNAMLKSTKLSHLYKCMARDCRFTSDVLALYRQHFHVHMTEEKKKNTPSLDYQKCPYCYTVLIDWNQMKTHMEEKHAHCRYQCNYCFYRAIAPSYVQIHQTMSHPGYHGILVGKMLKELPLKEEVNRHDYIHPYMCQHDCSKFFYVPEAFMAHLKSKHGALLSVFKCHLCCSTCLKVDQLLQHYKTHGYYKYQCLYCLNGSDTFNEMHNHLSLFHSNRLPQILERSLPPQPTRNKDVIDQLIIRSLDENMKSTTDIIEVDSELQDKESANVDVLSLNSSPPHKIAYPQLPKEITMIDKEENETLNKSMCSLFSSVTKGANSNATSTSATSPQLEKLSNDSCSDSNTNNVSLTVDNQTTETKQSPKEMNFTFPGKRASGDESESKHILQEPEFDLPSFASNDTNAMDPLEFSGSLDCSDEFININLLDNPDFLKNVNSRSSDVSFLNNMSESKAYDSDIEILDNDNSDANVSNLESALNTNTKDSSNVNEKTKLYTTERKTDEKDQSIVCSSAENSNASFDANENSMSVKSDQPLTLEDIKDTGFTGPKLYKCGYEACDFGAQTATLLRTHVKECTLRGDNKNLNCAHCNKRFVKIGFLLEHLKLHGLKRFGCSLCKMRCTVAYQAMTHMKTKHKFPNSKLIPADPKNPSADGLFVVQAIRPTGERKGKKRKSMKSAEKECERAVMDIEKLSFSPDEIDSLPRQAIYNREVQCAVCPYTTKVRTNIIRHLLLHAKDETVPETGPVNPVPCLDKKERMFDKMVNLASSSHQNGRMGGKPKEPVKDNDEEFIPKFVPEHKRYVCGVAECNYLTVDEAMLRYHLKALHSEEPYFRCPHCPQPQPGQESLNIAIDKMGVHLKMHDTRLYKCSHCNHHHYHRHVVERHLTDKHPEKRPFVKVIRELESTENSQQPVQEETEEEVPDPDGNHWKCNICEYKCVYKAEMVNHASSVHDEKCQFKCTLCTFKTSGKILFEQHISSKHSNDPNVDYVMIYQRIKGINKKNTDSTEQNCQEEPFDTTPLWRRDMPRIRHIRGILLEEEDEVPNTDSALKGAKRKSDVELLSTKPAKIKPGKSASLDENKQSKEKSKRSLSCEKISSETENPNKSSEVQKKSESDATPTKVPKTDSKTEPTDANDLNDSDVGRFGPYGKPDGNMYVCTLCTQFKSKYKHDMRDHLYRELNYARWHCKECGYLSVNRNALLKHFTKHHQGERPDHEPLSPDDAIEDWVRTLLKKQTMMIRETLSRLTNTVITNISAASKLNIPGITDTKTTTKFTSSLVNKAAKTDLSKTVSTLRDATVKSTVTDTVTDTVNEDSKDKEALVIDIKDENCVKKEKTEGVSVPDKAMIATEISQEKPLTCKHCKMIFTRWRGFKLHVQLTHLKRLGFICPYCDRSTNSETLMRQHIRSKHPGCEEKIVENPAAGGPELTNEFWEKEYGIICPKKSPKKRKRKNSAEEITLDNDNANQSDSQEKCTLCGFTAMNFTGLKAHMRVHAAKNSLSCAHCPFTASVKAELWEHWEDNHPFTLFKMEDAPAPGSSSETGVALQDKKRRVEDYSDDIEEEQVSISDMRDELIYCCFYCSLRSKSLDAIKSHWNIMHNDPKASNDPTKPKASLPFRYKEIHASVVSPQKTLKKTQLTKKESKIPYELYLQQTQNESPVEMVGVSGVKQEGWVCQWCNELCDSEGKMKSHQNMFHSHLPFNFKKQGSNEAPKGYVCPECSFTTTLINVMKSHVTKHINLFKCKYCDTTFGTSSQVSSHNAEKHPGLEFKIESIQNYEALLDKIMARVKWYKSGEGESAKDQEEKPTIEAPKNHAVAKKSTAKPPIRVHPISCKVKAVARKSTNPLSRFLQNVTVKQNEHEKSPPKAAKSKQFSYYGVPKTPVNLAKLNTYMVVGGHRMKVNCTTLAQLININPQIVLKDLKHDIKNVAALSKLK